MASQSSSAERLSRAVLKVVADRPGEAFALHGEKTSFADIPAGPMGQAAIQLVSGGLLSLAAMSGHTDELWMPYDVSCERSAGTLTIHDVNVVTSEERSETIELARVVKLEVKRRSDFWHEKSRHPKGATAPLAAEATLSIQAGSGEPRSRSLRLFIHGVDTREKIADVAYRLGAAMGMRFQRVWRNDPMRIEIEMQSDAGAGWAALPRIEAPADYDRGAIAAEASAVTARWKLLAWDPAKFPGETRIKEWSPGREVRADKPWQLFALGCLPIALAFFAVGPGVWLLMRDKVHENGLVATVGMVAVASVLGLAFGSLGLVAAASSLPRRVRLSWDERELTVSTLLRRRRIPFERLAGIEVDWALYEGGDSQGGGGPHANRFGCQVNALVGDAGSAEPARVLILDTEHVQDKDAPYDAVLPPAKALADALSLPLRVTATGNEKKR
jgi:hypothetical protein